MLAGRVRFFKESKEGLQLCVRLWKIWIGSVAEMSGLLLDRVKELEANRNV